MHKYVIKRLLALIPVILGVIFIIYLILYLTPGDAVSIIGVIAWASGPDGDR